jgi:hypothetical protein
MKMVMLEYYKNTSKYCSRADVKRDGEEEKDGNKIVIVPCTTKLRVTCELNLKVTKTGMI